MIHSSNTKGKILIVNIPLCILNFTEIYPSLLYKESKGHRLMIRDDLSWCIYC